MPRFSVDHRFQPFAVILVRTLQANNAWLVDYNGHRPKHSDFMVCAVSLGHAT